MSDKPNYMTHGEIETTNETLDHFDLTPAERTRAYDAVNQRARTAPFNKVRAYHYAQQIGAAIVREKK